MINVEGPLYQSFWKVVSEPWVSAKMSGQASSAVVLGADEKYEIAVSYGTIIATGALAILVCGTRVRV